MKKIISSILIAVVILQLFAPFSVGVSDKKLAINKNQAEAYDYKLGFTTISWVDYIKIRAKIYKGSDTMDYAGNGGFGGVSEGSALYLDANLYGSDGKGVDKAIGTRIKEEGEEIEIILNGLNFFDFKKLSPNTTYKLVLTLNEEQSSSMESASGDDAGVTTNTNTLKLFEEEISVKTLPEGSATEEIQKTVTTSGGAGSNVDAKRKAEEGSSGSLPACALWIGKGTPIGCVAQALYYVLFVPTSALFGLTGVALDFSLMYSISDASYRSAFVVEGWGIVRDFCNMFFIFIMLYIAFGTILNVHSVKTKEMIINVIIIGLLINFSLFATQVIIDTSNIITRVFYNQNTIVTGTADSSGKVTGELGKFGELQLTQAIISKVNPQRLILEAEKAGQVPIRGQANNEDQTKTDQGITTGTFILVTILATAINIFGLIAFLSCAIIFISRVVGLWMAMILAPLAFFSYTVPALQSMQMVGWKHWWPETLKLAFLAPVFAFFMYIIVAFMSTGFDIINTDGKTGIAFLVGIIVPFVFIIVLLNKAKDIAKDMSGEIGKSITNGINAIGGLALGGAAGGVALLGRQVLGKGVAAMSRGDSANHLATQKFTHNQALEKWEANGRTGPKPTYVAPKHGDVIGKDKNGQDIKYQKNPFTYIGGKLNEKQKAVGAIDHARHKQDETKKSAGLEGVDNENLSGENIKTMEGKYKQAESGNIESQFKKGVDAKGNVLSMTDAAGYTYTGENDFKAQNRQDIIHDIQTAPAPGDVDLYTGDLTDAGRKKVEDRLNQELNTVIKANVDIKLKTDFEKMMKEASSHVNPLARSFSTSNKNSYDVRKLSEMKTDKRESFLSKGTIGLAALIATGVRGGIRGSGFGNSQVKVEGDFMKDLGATISDSLKSMKVNVNLSGVGEHKSSADSHGGGDHH